MNDDERMLETMRTKMLIGERLDPDDVVRLIELADTGLSSVVEIDPNDGFGGAGEVFRLTAWRYQSAGTIYVAYCQIEEQWIHDDTPVMRGCGYNTGKRTRPRDAMRSVSEHLRGKHELDIGFDADRSKAGAPVHGQRPPEPTS